MGDYYILDGKDTIPISDETLDEVERERAKWDAEIEAAYARGFHDALEEAAKVAEPQQRRDGNGLWVVRRRKIAAAIRALAGKE